MASQDDNQLASPLGRSNRGASALAGATLVFISMGAAIGSGALLVAAALTATVLVVVMSIRPPTGISATRSIERTKLWIDDTTVIDVEMRIESGIGPVFIHSPVPSMMELAEGSNFTVVWKGRRPTTFKLRYSLRATMRGNFPIEPMQWEAHHPFRIRQPVRGTTGESELLIVRPRIDKISRVMNIRGLAVNPRPMMDISVIGNRTTDFNEIRRYTPGDPIRTINWKATARRSAGSQTYGSQLLVNEFEREGKKAIWLFLDASPKMQIGTTLLNPLEHAIEATVTLSYYYLKRGYQMGAHFSNRPTRIIHADSGQAQLRKLNRELLELTVSKEAFDFRQAVQVCRHQILRYVPECFIITRLDDVVSDNPDQLPESLEALLEGIKQLTRHGTRGLHSVNVNLVAIAGYAYSAGEGSGVEMMQSLRKIETRSVIRKIQRYGVNVIEWNPMDQRFSDVLLSHAIGVRQRA